MDDDGFRARGTRGGVWGALVLVALVLAAYWPSLGGDFVWDDDDYVSENAMVQAEDGLGRIWFTTESPQYYPLTFTTFWVEWRLWGAHTAGYHVVNVLLHSANALLFWLVLRRLGLRGAWLAALVFALHPLQVESVAWIAERKNTLSGMFYLSAFWAFWRFSGGGGLRWWAASVVLLAGALLSKTTTVMFPAVMVVLLWWAGRLGRRNLLALAPLLVMALVMSGVTIWYETTQVQAEGEEWSAGMLERTALAGKIVWFYLYKLFVPGEFIYNYPRWEIDPRAWVSYLPAAALVAGAAVMLLRRASWDRVMLAGLGSYVIGLFPVMGFFNIYYMRYSPVADRFAYLPGLGVIALAVCGPAHLLGGRRPASARVVAAAVVLFLGVQTWRQSGAYADAETLYRDTLAKNETSWLAHNQLGTLLMRRHAFAEAEKHFRRVLELNPKLEEGYNNVRLALVYQDRYKEAIEVARKGVKQARSNVRITLELARMLAMAPDPSVRDGFEAVLWGEVVVRTSKGQSAEALDVLASAYAEQGRYRDAIRTARKALVRAGEQGLYEMARQIQARLELYESGRAYHAPIVPPPAEIE